MEKIRMRLWERYLTIRALHGQTITFDQFWYEFLTRHFISNSPSEVAYEDVCVDLEKRVT